MPLRLQLRPATDSCLPAAPRLQAPAPARTWLNGSATVLVILLFAPGLDAAPPLRPTLESQPSGVHGRLQAISAVNERVAWASGLSSRFTRTTDGGAHWQSGQLDGPADLELRDIHALDRDRAYVLSAGAGERSRIFKTKDGGATWTLQFLNPDPDAFYNCFAFWDENTGVAFSDSVAERFPVLRTTDGGRGWELVHPQHIPAASDGEGGFAASGSCVLSHGARHGWIATGAGAAARVLHTSDRGNRWQAAVVPMEMGGARGLTALAFWSSEEGLAGGGNVLEAETGTPVVALTDDGGSSWSRAEAPPLVGPIYGAATVPEVGGRAVVVVGPGGAAYSTDGAASWTLLSTDPYWSVAFASPDVGWMVGPGGRITKVSW